MRNKPGPKPRTTVEAPVPDPLYSLAEAAAYLGGISERHLYRLAVEERKLAYSQPGGRKGKIFIRLSELNRWADRTLKTSKPVPKAVAL